MKSLKIYVLIYLIIAYQTYSQNQPPFSTLSSDAQNSFLQKSIKGQLEQDSLHFFGFYMPLLRTVESQQHFREVVTINGFMGHFLGFGKINPEHGITYLKKAVAIAKQHQLTIEEGIFTSELAEVYRLHGQTELAYEYFLKSYEIIAKINKQIPDACRRLLSFGQFFYGIQEHKQALKVFLEAQKAPFYDHWSQMQILNYIAESYRQLNQLSASLHWHQKLLHVAQKNKDTLWVGITSGNMGAIYIKQNQLNLAKPLCTLDFETSMKYKDYRNAGFALQHLARINVSQKHIDEALKQLLKALSLIETQKNELDNLGVYRDLADVYEQKHNFAQALFFQKKSVQLADSLDLLNDAKKYERIEQKLTNERAKQVELQRLQAENFNFWLRLSLVCTLCLIIVVIVQFYRTEKIRFTNEKKQIKQQQALLVSENQLMQSALTHAQTQLDDFVLQVRKNVKLNELLFKEEDQTELKNSLAKVMILTETDWQKFKLSFDKIYTNFFEKLLTRYPNLSQAEIRLLALTKLNFNTEEMAYSLGIGTNTIKKTRQRVRQKIEISEKESLADWLALIT